MPIKLFVSEVEARGFSVADSYETLRGLIDHYDDDVLTRTAVTAAVLDDVTLAPSPVFCELPRRGHDSAVEVRGYAKSALRVYGRRVAVISTAVSIDSGDTQGGRAYAENELAQVGTVWTSQPLKDPLATAERFIYVAQADADREPRVLNLRLATAKRANEQFQLLGSRATVRTITRSTALPNTPSVWGRVVFLNDGVETLSALEDETFESLTVRLGSETFELRIGVGLRRLQGAEDDYLVMVACGGPFDDRQARAVGALLTEWLGHALAHEWLATRAEQVNDRQAECISWLLDGNADVILANDLRRQMGVLRYAFVDELEIAWSHDAAGQAGACDFSALLDRPGKLALRWRRETRRFERLLSVASSTVYVPSQASMELPDLIPGLKERHNIFGQIKMWWEHRGGIRGGAADVLDSRRATLQRPGPRRGYVPVGARRIELRPFSNRPSLFWELSSSISFTSFMTAASAVFLGVVLKNGEHKALPMDILFLFVATFGFLFATLIYANASGRLARLGTFGYEAQVEIANRVSEHLGVFPLLIAIPLSVARFLDAGPIPWAVAMLGLVATTAYHYLRGASLLERDISDDRIGSDWQRRFIIVPLIVIFMAATLVGQLVHVGWIETVGAVGFGVGSVVMLLLSAMLPERTNPQEYIVDDWDHSDEAMPA